jgi:hypothetical protein
VRHNAGMRKRSSKKRDDDSPVEPTAEPAPEAQQADGGKNPAAVALGRLGGKKGGLARAAKLTKEQRTEIAKKAAQARWANRRHQ